MDNPMYGAMVDLGMVNYGVFPKLVSAKLHWDYYLGYVTAHESIRLANCMFAWSPILRYSKLRLPNYTLPDNGLGRPLSDSLVSLDIETTWVVFSRMQLLQRWFPKLESVKLMLDCREFASSRGMASLKWTDTVARVFPASGFRVKSITIHPVNLCPEYVPFLKLMLNKRYPSIKHIKLVHISQRPLFIEL